MIAMKGNPVSPGIAIGEIFVYKPFELKMPENNGANDDNQMAVYMQAINLADRELRMICESMEQHDPEKAKIFRAHMDILHDDAMDEEIQEMIRTEEASALWAVETVFSIYAKQLAKSKDPLIAERAVDIIDVKKRLLRCIVGEKEQNLSQLTQPVIVATHDLLPSDTATLNRKMVLGIVTEVGGTTSHSAILAREYGIPAVLGVSDMLSAVEHGQTIVLDAEQGELILEPEEETLRHYEKRREACLARENETRKYLDKEPLTADAVRIDMGLNVGSVSDEDLAAADFTDYVGLFRTEFLYMNSDHLPTEQEQFEAYKKILEAYGERYVTIRTLDIGGDKTLEYMSLPKEQNPFLGERALRFCFSHPDLFRTQLRALLRASVYGNLHIMLPMVTSIEDIRRGKALIEQIDSELRGEGISVSDTYEVGIMVEVPSIALVADLAAKEVDFASIGTNDLCQYLTATDRMNPQVTEYYQSYHPAMFRMMRFVIKSFQDAGKGIGVCGELGGDSLAGPVLVGMGLRNLSMNPSSIPAMKKSLSGLTVAQMEEMAQRVCTFAAADEVKNYLKKQTNQERG